MFNEWIHNYSSRQDYFQEKQRYANQVWVFARLPMQI